MTVRVDSVYVCDMCDVCVHGLNRYLRKGMRSCDVE